MSLGNPPSSAAPASRPAWTTRAETPDDRRAVRAVLLAAFPTHHEADLVEDLRADVDAWIDGFSVVATTPAGEVVAHALLTRCRVGGHPALALAPCSVDPHHQRSGAGSAAIRAALDAARGRGENLVVVLGHADYYPRFGFTPASAAAIRATVEVPDDAFLVVRLDRDRPVPGGTVEYPPAFGLPRDPLASDELTLRRWTPHELDAVRERRSSPLFADDFPADGDREIARLIDRHGDIADEYGHRLLVEHRSGSVIGSASLLWPPEDDGSVEIGFGVVPSHRGRGYAVAAARALVDHAFTRPDVAVVVAGAESDNEASLRVLAKAGFERTGTDGTAVRFARGRTG